MPPSGTGGEWSAHPRRRSPRRADRVRARSAGLDGAVGVRRPVAGARAAAAAVDALVVEQGVHPPGLGRAFWLSIKYAVIATACRRWSACRRPTRSGRATSPGAAIVLLGLFATNAFPRMGLFTSTGHAALRDEPDGDPDRASSSCSCSGTVVTMMWIPAAAFASVPPSMLEAARDAGAGAWRMFWSITLRRAVPGIAVALILAFLACFDEAQGTYLVGGRDAGTHAHRDVHPGRQLPAAGRCGLRDRADHVRASSCCCCWCASTSWRPPGGRVPTQMTDGLTSRPATVRRCSAG